jgi:hypothetical protein
MKKSAPPLPTPAIFHFYKLAMTIYKLTITGLRTTLATR